MTPSATASHPGGPTANFATPHPRRRPIRTAAALLAGAAVTSSALSRSTPSAQTSSRKWLAVAVAVPTLAVGALAGTLLMLRSKDQADDRAHAAAAPLVAPAPAPAPISPGPAEPAPAPHPAAAAHDPEPTKPAAHDPEPTKPAAHDPEPTARRRRGRQEARRSLDVDGCRDEARRRRRHRPPGRRRAAPEPN